jgi:16S rRNA processing protein RimM
VTDRLDVGRISRAHGLRGDLVIAPITNRGERFAVGSELFDGAQSHRIVTSRRQGDHFVVHFDGIDDRASAELLRGRVLQAEPLTAEPGEVFVHELIGARVIDQHDRALGVVRHVEANPAHDILVCDTGVLIPIVFVGEVVDEVVHVDVPDGLVELYLGE